MKTFKILHVEDDIDCNFLLTESLRKEKSAKVDWASNRAITEKMLGENKYDLIICDGCIPGWDNHFAEVLKWAQKTKVCVYSAKIETEFGNVAFEDGTETPVADLFEIYSKASEGTHNLIKYIKGRINHGRITGGEHVPNEPSN